ncbi:MAG TPA: alanine dehydrogenase [Bacteroidales bacterium]|jgi:alanine dehydrogenase|nr:alanine dehydrogenase [Bacteroidales bacterium]MDI9533870.1 alanine dehydrogenase [Bacteroidota bacterium]MBK7732277.1 alanine dehydrogenase [Bacteroidales bacterium]MBP7036617.1 alanine dehydrogenase [Bacteroidales bacterium]MBP8709497.1 alanine dehydrogenase [Bacteroidales bacterium]
MNEPARSALLPREEQIEKAVGRKQMSIGLPRDVHDDEKRIPLTPEAIRILTDAGNEIFMERGAGQAAGFTDREYSDNGAIVADTPSRIYECDIIIKITPFKQNEASQLKVGQTVISFMNVATMDEDVLSTLMRKRVTALASEKIKDTDGMLPVVESMSEISGITSVLLASEYLSSASGGKGVMLGGVTGVTPTEVIIIGANTAGEYAARAALGLGAIVRVFDASVHRLRNFQNLLGQRIYTSTFHPQVLQKALKSADVLIGALSSDILMPWFYVTEEMVQGMKRGSVIIDLSVDTGGCVETAEPRAIKDPIYEKHGVIHYSAWNLPSRVPKTASIALSNVFRPLMQEMADAGSITHMLRFNPGLRSGVYIYNGILTNDVLGQKFGILSQDINLLLAAF